MWNWEANAIIIREKLVGAFNHEKALVGAFSVIVKTDCGTDGALHSTTSYAYINCNKDNKQQSRGALQWNAFNAGMNLKLKLLLRTLINKNTLERCSGSTFTAYN